jgi:hypothetical protein
MWKVHCHPPKAAAFAVAAMAVRLAASDRKERSAGMLPFTNPWQRSCQPSTYASASRASAAACVLCDPRIEWCQLGVSWAAALAR